MSDDNIKKLSEQFLDLWQRQLTATMKNPEIVGSMMEMLHTMQSNMGKLYDFPKQETSATDTDLSEPGDDELLELDRRIRKLEKRIDKLESGTKSKS